MLKGQARTVAETANERQASNAARVCNALALSRVSGDPTPPISSEPSARFTIDQQQAASALVHTAIAHVLERGNKPMPKAVMWKGRRWFLSYDNAGRVLVGTYPGERGIESLAGAVW